VHGNADDLVGHIGSSPLPPASSADRDLLDIEVEEAANAQVRRAALLVALGVFTLAVPSVL
jgi:hypothetical protein